MKISTIIMALFLFYCSSLFALTLKLEDKDLTGPTDDKIVFDTDFFRPDKIKYDDLSYGHVAISIRLYDGPEFTNLTDLSFKLRYQGKTLLIDKLGKSYSWKVCHDNPDAIFSAETLIDHTHFRIQNHKGQKYELLFKGHCNKHNTLIFDNRGFGGQALSIWQMALKTYKKFTQIRRIDFWNKKIIIEWPGMGNNYDFKKVSIYKAYQWDIMAHEIGHAIYDMAKIGTFGVGEHYIDKCYNKALALSEGWASFFSAWLNISPDDPDAKFEYMVPRRAPIHVENVPDDVCFSQKNEWRVFAFLWDLIDRNDDGENIAISFEDLWDLTAGSKVLSLLDIRKKLVQHGVEKEKLDDLWQMTILGR